MSHFASGYLPNAFTESGLQRIVDTPRLESRFGLDKPVFDDYPLSDGVKGILWQKK